MLDSSGNNICYKVKRSYGRKIVEQSTTRNVAFQSTLGFAKEKDSANKVEAAMHTYYKAITNSPAAHGVCILKDIPKIMSRGPLAAAGGVISTGQTHKHAHRIRDHYYGYH